MAKSDNKHQAYERFTAANGVPHIRIPEFDVQFMSDQKLSAIGNASRKNTPKHAKWLGEYSESRILVERKEGDEYASAVYAFDEEAAKLLIAAGAKLVRMAAFPIGGHMASAQDDRLATVMALREELGIPVRSVSNPASENVRIHGAGKRKGRKQRKQERDRKAREHQERALLAHFEARGAARSQA